MVGGLSIVGEGKGGKTWLYSWDMGVLMGARRDGWIGDLLRRGRWIGGRWVRMCYARGEGHGIVVLVRRSMGKATKRNLVRRRVREICRRNGLRGLNGWRVALWLRDSAKDASYEELREDISDLLKKAGFLRK